jgi:hypothetical protein
MKMKNFSALVVLMLLFVTQSFAEVKLGQIVQQTLTKSGGFTSDDSTNPILSPDAKRLTFTSKEKDLIENDINLETADIFVKDLTNSSLTIQSRDNAGIQGDYLKPSLNQAISFIGPNNQYVLAFQSASENFLPSGSGSNPNGVQHIFARFSNSKGFETQLISVAANSVPGNGNSKLPSIGIFPQDRLLRIAFQTNADNIVPPGVDPQGFSEILLAEIKESDEPGTNPAIKRISESSSGEEPNGECVNPQVSTDAQFVVFVSNATNLVSESNNPQKYQVYLYNVKTGALTLISKSKTGVAGSDDSGIDPCLDCSDFKIGARVSFNGRYVVYVSRAPNITGLSGSNFAVVRYDAKLGVNEVVNQNESGVFSDGSVNSIGISGDGRYVVFSDTSTNFLTDNGSGFQNIYIKDMDTGQLLPVSRGFNVPAANGNSFDPSIALNGFNGTSGYIAFASKARNLTTSPFGTGTPTNIFTVPITLPKPEIANGSPIDLPPEVTVINKRIKIQMQPFTIPNSLRATSKSSVKYDVTIIPQRARNGPRRKITTKRTRVTSRNLKPGTYTTTYKASVIKKGKVKAKSGQSPKIQFTIS